MNYDGRSPLHLAARYGNLDATRALLVACADATRHASSSIPALLSIAACIGHAEVVNELIRHGVDVDASSKTNGCTALHQAAWRSKAGIVDALVEAGASVTAQTVSSGKTPLLKAIESLAHEALHALLRHRASVRAWRRGDGIGQGSKSLHSAAGLGGKQGAAEVVDLVLRWGADESDLDDDGNTAAEVLGVHAPRLKRVAEDADRVRKLLANTPADRPWRHRGMLLL